MTAVVVAFAGLLVALEVVARAAEPRLPVHLHWHDLLTTGKWHQLRRLRREAPVDVLLAGSSQMLTAVDPTLVPGRCYNAALYRGIPTMTVEWLRDEVLPATRPRTVVWGLSILDLNDNGEFHRGVYERYTHAPARATGLARVVAVLRLRSAAVRRLPLLVRPLRLARHVRRGHPARKPLSTVLGPMGKGVEYADHATYQLSDAKRAFIEREIVGAFRMGGAQIEAVRRGAALIRATGARLVLLEMPCTGEFRDMYPHGDADVAAARELLRRTAEEIGADFVPTDSDELARDWFTDCVHLNGVGMTRWTPDVVRRLEQREPACVS